MVIGERDRVRAREWTCIFPSFFSCLHVLMNGMHVINQALTSCKSTRRRVSLLLMTDVNGFKQGVRHAVDDFIVIA